jgi:excisionase family DNA binding protein
MPTPTLEGTAVGKKLSIQEVAAIYGVSPRSVRRYIAAGRLTALRVGPRLIRLDAAQVEKELGGEPIAAGFYY